MKVVETVIVIGTFVFRGELLEVSGRSGDRDGLWLRRLWPGPCLEYGTVRFPLSPRPLHSASMWTADWPMERRADLAGHAVGAYRDWIAEGCPFRESLAAALDVAVAS